MKTSKKLTTGSILLTISSLFLASVSFAQESGKFLNEKPKDLYISFYIIGGVLGFGILIFAIAKIAAKYSKEDNSPRKTPRYISHRHHHHHKVIKKSA